MSLMGTTNLLGLIKKTCPWYWEMSALIGERPNVTPVGLGNNQSDYDTSLLMPNESEGDDNSNLDDIDIKETIDIGDDEDSVDHKDIYDAEWEKAMHESSSSAAPGDGDEPGKEEDDRKVQIKVPKAPNIQGGPSRKKMTEPKPAISKRVEPPGKKEKVPKKTPIDRFGDVAIKEEETTQKQLELKKTKARGQSDERIAEIQAKANVKMQKDRLKAEYAQKKMDHEYHMAQMAQAARSQAQNSVFGSDSFASSSSTQFPTSFGSSSYSSGWPEAPSAGTSTPGSLTQELNNGDIGQSLEFPGSLGFSVPESG